MTVSRINRYILQQLLIMFGFFALVLVLIYWINRAVRLFDQLIADGQSAWVFLEFTALTIPAILSTILPIAAFAAAVYQFNRLSNDSELSILQATGHSGARLLRPFFVFGVAVCVMQGVLQHVLVPTSLATLKVRTVQTAENATARLLQEGTFLNATDDVKLFIEGVSAQGELENIFLHERRDDRTITYTATRAFLVRSETGPKLVLIDGLIQTQADPQAALTTTRFNDFVIDVSRFLSVGPVAPDRVEDLNSFALATADGFERFDVQLEWAVRTLSSLLPLVAVVLGVATLMSGGFSRLGIWQYILYAFVLLIVVKLIEGFALDVVRSERSQLWLLVFPVLFGAVVSFALILRRDKPWRTAPLSGGAA